MTSSKNAAAKATFVNQNSLPKTKAVLNQVVADLYTAHIALHRSLVYAWCWFLWFGIQKWMNTWKSGCNFDEVKKRLITLGGKPYLL